MMFFNNLIFVDLVPVQKPFSWASLAGKGTSSSAASTTQAAAPPKPQATIKPERKTDSNVNTQSQPQQQRAPRRYEY